ncbi:MAG: M23 family metallopeptidase [Paenibacillaceae bacterium]
MDWILAFMLMWSSLGGASDAYVQQQEAIAAANMQIEVTMFKDTATAETTISEPLAIVPNEVQQGDAVLIRSQSEQTVTWNKSTYPLLPFGLGYYTLLPVPIDMKPGTYEVGGQTLTILNRSFDTQRIEVTEEQNAMRYNSERIKQDQKKIDKARSDSEPTFLFNGPFIQPVAGRLTTSFGLKRYVNGVSSGSHKAIDLANPTGTEIKATNAGKIVLAEELYLTGNSIYIDHGMGLFSQYAHMSKLLVKPGDKVDAGQVIGLVGTTGFSTGPHLHFTFWIHNVQANPFYFFESSPFYWEDNNNP